MNYDYLVYSNYSPDFFQATCILIEGMIPGIRLTDSVDTVDGPIKNYRLGNKKLSVFGRVRDNDVCVSSEFELDFLKRRPVTYD